MELFDGTGVMSFLYAGGGILIVGILFIVLIPVAWVCGTVEQWRFQRALTRERKQFQEQQASRERAQKQLEETWAKVMKDYENSRGA